MATTQIDGNRQIKAATITADRIVAAAGIETSKLADGAEFLVRSGSVALTGDLNANTTHKVVNLAEPTNPQDAATKNYVDAIATGLDVKKSVRAATTANGTLGTAFANGQVIDGVTLATGDRILLKNQSTGAENGIYTVNASGAPTRATDADSNAEVTAGMFTFVEEGTVNADSGWVLTNDGAIVLGTTALTFSQFSSAATVSGGAGLVKTGTVLDVVAGDDSILVNADELHVQIKDASLETVTGGIRVKLATNAGDVYIGTTTTKVATPTTLSGDIATITGAGVVTLAATVYKAANFVTRETPTGSINGSNTSFALANTPTAGTEEVFLNGILQEPGAGNDYTISGGTITMLSAPLTGDRLRVNYRK